MAKGGMDVEILTMVISYPPSEKGEFENGQNDGG
jgi:hypothetical protein